MNRSPYRQAAFSAITMIACSMALISSASAADYNIGQGYSTVSNPTPSGIWSYGWSASLTSPMILFNQVNTTGVIHSWNDSAVGSPPNVAHNSTGLLQGVWPPDAVGLHPGPAGQFSRIRFTAPESERYWIALEFAGLDAATTDVYVIHNNTLPALFAGEVDGQGSIQEYFTSGEGLLLHQGDTIDFVVGHGANGNSVSDTTGVFTTITKACSADVMYDGVINVDDLLHLLASWGPCTKGSACPDLAPLGGDGEVNVDDLLVLLANWGPCQ